MIDYTKLFQLLNEREMKKTDLLEIISSGTLAKLSKGGIIQTDTIDKICLFLNVQPNAIMEVYRYKEIDGRKIKTLINTPDGQDDTIQYGFNTSGIIGISLTDLKYALNKNGTLNIDKLDELIKKAEKDEIYPKKN